MQKDRQPLVVKRGEARPIRALGAQVSFLCGAEATGRQWSLSEVSAPKDAGPPPHHHPWDEAYYILEGELDFTIGDEKVRVGAGDFLYAPGGTVHAFHGISEKPARLLIFDAPAAAEAFFLDVEREVQELPRDLAKVPEIGRRHKLRFLEPAG
ncbi:MAG TPA: cupin domain-containing protein [Usitatibacter sp.]|jgi:quercetin dioxygenase-like cupin family protein